jgi:ABC-type branched-subunit amino acid transport system ATPase component
MITASHLRLAYGDRVVLDDFSATCAQGTITAIIGVNGCGKSTLLAALAGDIAPAAGDITLDGASILTMKKNELSKLRALAQQSHQYWMAYTADEILRLSHEDVAADRFAYVIEKLAISNYLNQSVTTLSGGQLQRIEIARSLLRQLPIVMLDEPFASQDMKSIAAIRELLREESASGRTVLLVAHARREDLSWCDQVIEISAR